MWLSIIVRLSFNLCHRLTARSRVLKLFNFILTQLLCIRHNYLTNTISSLSSYQHMMDCCRFNHTGLTYYHDEDRTMRKIRTRSKLGCLLSVCFVYEASQSFWPTWDGSNNEKIRLFRYNLKCQVDESHCLGEYLRFSRDSCWYLSLYQTVKYIAMIPRVQTVESSPCPRRWKLEDGRGPAGQVVKTDEANIIDLETHDLSALSENL